MRHNKYEVQKFQREAYLLRSLLHPGVLRVFGFCKIDHLLVTEVRAVCIRAAMWVGGVRVRVRACVRACLSLARALSDHIC